MNTDDQELSIDVEREVAACANTDGVVHAQAVVDAARDEASPLHGHFEWDDSIASEQYRLIQARSLIRRIKMTVTVQNIPLRTNVYVSEPKQRKVSPGGYSRLLDVRSDEERSRDLVIDEMNRAVSSLTRAKTIAKVLGAEDAIENLESQTRSLMYSISQEPIAAQ